MGKKKAFIEKNEGIKFNLLHRSQKDPLLVSHETSDRVLAPAPKRSKNLKRHQEQLKYGIYLDDDYNYLQHLKATNEIDGDIEDRTVIKVPEGTMQLPSTLFETKGVQLKVGLLNKAAPSAVEPCALDPDVVEVLGVLDGDIECDSELDDDFMDLIKGTDDSNEDAEVDSFNPLMDEKSGKADMMARMGLVREQFSDEDSDIDSGDDFDKEDDLPQRPGNRNRITDLMTCGSISSSCMPRNEGKRMVDDHFEQIAEEYGDEHIGYGEDDEDNESGEEEVDLNKVSQAEWKQKLNELRGTAKIRFDELELPDDEIKRKTLLADSVDNLEKMEHITLEPSGRKRNHWDAESILSTYSNAYNHPTLIKEPSKKKFGLTKKDLNALNNMEIDKISMISATSVSTFRPKGETAEERRARKLAVKEAKRERRIEKKANKIAFGEAARAMDIQIARAQVKGRPIK